MTGGRVYLPMWTAGMLPCCLTTIRASRDAEHEGFAKACAICYAPLRVRNGAWEVANLQASAAATDPRNTRLDDHAA